jgi:hypothetical protein
MPSCARRSAVSLLAFDFFILPPVRTLSLEDVRNWTALVVHLLTGVVASELAAAARRRARQAETRERKAALLADLAPAARSGGAARASIEAALDGLESTQALLGEGDRERCTRRCVGSTRGSVGWSRTCSTFRGCMIESYLHQCSCPPQAA